MKVAEPTVFVIDDDESIREALKDLLESVGLRVETFASAPEFLQSRHSRQLGASEWRLCRNSGAEANVSTRRPTDSRRSLRASRIDSSSSMTNTVGSATFMK